MSGFVHLHNHSDYSLLDGACRISDYVRKAKEFGMKHVALTDHGSLSGVLHFERSCHKEGINPVVGCEVYVAPKNRFHKPVSGPKSYHLVLYAKNETGYKNLMLLTSKGYLEGFYYRPRIDDELLEQHHEGIMASAACLAGEIPRYITAGDWDKALAKTLYYNDLFGEGNFWLEVMNHGLPEEETVRHGMRRLNEETGIPIIATNDVHFISKDHYKAQDIFICIATGKKLDDKKRLKTETPEFYFKSEEEMRTLFPDFPDALENTVKLAEQCCLTIPQSEPILPHYKIPAEFSEPKDYLHHLTIKGLKERYPQAYQESETLRKTIEERAEYELQVLCDMGYSGYFLIVWDFIDWARRNDIPVGPGRGSGAGSIVAYALKITDIDPLKYDLLFERFLNPERVSMPDFDIDFCYERRSEVIEYVHGKYGRDNVAGICTFGTLKTKAVLKDVARVLDIPFSESNEITKLIPSSIQKDEGEGEDEDEEQSGEKKKINVKTALELEPKLREFYQRGGIYRDLFDVASTLEGMNRHVSTHACGQVIGREALTNYVPLIKDQKSQDVVTAYTMDIIEHCGLIKMDFLGLKTLTLLKNCEKLIQRRVRDFNLDTIQEDDEATFKMLGEGRSDAVFQFESSGMKRILRDAKPSSIEDLIALNALYRPGPMKFIPQFIESKMGRTRITYPHPDLEDILKPTYGVIVYQEQVMKVAQVISGFSLGKADILRRAMGKKKEEEMAKVEEEFVKGAVENGYTEKLARELFNMLKPFAGYGFNKSHAAAYSVLAYKTAYCKANYPAEFWSANLTNSMDEPDTLKNYLLYTKSEGIKILPPNVNLSEQTFTVDKGRIIYGLKGIKGMGQAAATAIISARNEKGKFSDILDFLIKVDRKYLNQKVLETAIYSGLFDSIESRNRATLVHNIDKLLSATQRRQQEEESGQGSLFEEAEEELETDFQWEEVDGWPKSRYFELEKEHLGFYVSGHPLDSYRKQWEKTVNLDLGNIPKSSPHKQYSLLGMIRNIRSFFTRKNKEMATAELEDFNGEIKLTLFSQAYERYEHLLVEDAIVGIIGSIEMRNDIPEFKVHEIIKPKELKESKKKEIHIELADMEYTETDMIDLRSFLQERPGQGKLFLHIPGENGYTIIRASSQISLSLDESNLDLIRERSSVISAWKE